MDPTIGVGFGVLIALSLLAPAPKDGAEELDYASFRAKVAAGQVASVEIHQDSGKVEGRLDDGTEFTAQGPPGGLPEADIRLLDAHEVDRNYAAKETSNPLGTILLYVLPFLLIVGVLVWMSRRATSQLSDVTGFTRSRARVTQAERPGTTFADIAGYDTVKEEIREVVDFLRDPAVFSAIGAKIPKGILLVGPPGSGKTLFARAIAGEARVPFISITGSEFLEMFVGVGAARVRDLFATARKETPSIVFVDEIDAIGRKRGTGLGGGHDEREQTLNQLLAEMDGFETTEGIVMLAATNRPDILDPALLRAGRFDRQVLIPLPTAAERAAILAVHSRGKRLAGDVDLDLIALGTPGMSGAELANLVNEAALIAVRRHADEISTDDLDAARDRVLLGLRRTSLVLTPDEKRTVAYHEAGHALLANVLPYADPVHKVTILPTGMALGATQQLPTEERQIRRRPELDDALAVRLGGPCRRGARLRGGVDGRPRRPGRRHRPRPAHGAGMGHVRAPRPHRLGRPGTRVPGRGAHPHPRLLRRDRPHHRRGDHADARRPGRPGHRRARGLPGSTRRRSPPPCSNTKPSTAPTSPGSSRAPRPTGTPQATTPLTWSSRQVHDVPDWAARLEDRLADEVSRVSGVLSGGRPPRPLLSTPLGGRSALAAYPAARRAKRDADTRLFGESVTTARLTAWLASTSRVTSSKSPPSRAEDHKARSSTASGPRSQLRGPQGDTRGGRPSGGPRRP